MAGKFMKVRKVAISTLTMLMIASQLCGCAAANSQEMLQMIDNQQVIQIEIAEPVSVEQGEEKQLEWIELAYLNTYPEFREVFDDTLGITAHGTNGKNGIVYVDENGVHTNNSTLFYAFSNQKFLDNCWNNSGNLNVLVEAAKKNYVDVETDAEARVAILNAYFNFFADAEPNYFNGSQTLTRGEYLAGVYRAANPVSDIVEDKAFKDSVDPNGTDETTIFANQMLEHSYLSTGDSSLNASTYSGKISRAEAIYTIVQMYFKDAYEATTGKESTYSDAKNGGDIASEVGFITKDKKTGEVTTKTYWMSYELSYALKNPDKGMPDDLYRALVVAKQFGLISGTESRWDESITKAEAINLITKAYETLGTEVSVDRGSSTGEDLAVDNTDAANQETNSNEESEDGVVVNGTSGLEQADDYEQTYCTINPMESTTMYVIKDCGRYINPNQSEGEIVVLGGYNAGDEIIVDGTAEYNGVKYYTTTNGLNEIYFIKADCLSATTITEEAAPEVTPAPEADQGAQNNPSSLPSKEEELETIKDNLRNQGFSDAEINELLGLGGGSGSSSGGDMMIPQDQVIDSGDLDWDAPLSDEDLDELDKHGGSLIVK